MGSRSALFCFTPSQRQTPSRFFDWGFADKNSGDDLLSHGLSHTTIGAAAFHFRVRDGIGWFHSADFTRERDGGSLSDVLDEAPASRRDL